VGLGTIAWAVAARSHDEVVLVSDYLEGSLLPYLGWLSSRACATISVYYRKFSSPTHFDEIHETTATIFEGTLHRQTEEVALRFGIVYSVFRIQISKLSRFDYWA